MVEPLKIGIIGAGPRANSLFNSVVMNPKNEDKVEINSIFDLNADAVADWRYKVDSTHTSFDAFLKEELDAVIIGTPPSTHAGIAKRCLEAGIHVWSEVPMGLTMDEIYSIIDADKANKGNRGRFCLGENYCYMLQPQFIAQQNRKNAFGDIYYAEGEYTHSVEHYMIFENYNNHSGKILEEVDPQLAAKVTPTWRANYVPIMYGHALGPALYALNANSSSKIYRPVLTTCMGNMMMQDRFNTDNFQIALVQTDQGTIIKFVIGFVLGHHGRIFYSVWGSGGIFNGGSFQTKDHHYASVPDDQRYYPARLEVKPQTLSDDDLKEMGTPHGSGGHGGGDPLMFESWINSLIENKPLEIDVFRSAEMTAPGILANQSEKSKTQLEIPRFE